MSTFLRLLPVSWALFLPACVPADQANDPPVPRQIGKLPPIPVPVLFNTPEADRILAALQVFPTDNPWNEDISQLTVHPDSARIVASIGLDKPIRTNLDMNFVLVPGNQPKLPLLLTTYAEESDRGPFPIPDTMPIEDWPLNGFKLETHQRQGKGDRHAIVVDPENGKLFEFYQARRTDTGWQAAQASVFDLRTNELRKEGWTSADAAGLPIFPAIVRYDEVARGAVDHALRVTVRRTRRAFAYPATHFASRSTDTSLPRMGERLRLRADFDVSKFSPHAQAILKALKKYGMLVADNGADWFVSIAPDARIHGLDELRRVKGKDFEVVRTTGPNEGPRARP